MTSRSRRVGRRVGRRARLARCLVGVLALASTLAAAGCGGEDYCGAVTSHQRELSDLVAQNSPTALLQGLPALEDLRAKAPDDIADDWQQVVSRLRALRDALRDAGVDPADYDPAKPPAGLTSEQRTAIAAAATEVGSATTQQAFDAVQQQVLDVCHTPLTR